MHDKPLSLLYKEETSSTNDDVQEIALQGGEHLTTVWANSQTKGRGRLGRTWETFPDVSLAFSVLIRENGYPQLPLVIALALKDELSLYAPVTIKWPNDILKDRKKIAGVLVEQKGGVYIVGIGVNLSPPSQIPDNFNGSFLLKEPLETHSRKELVESIVKRVGHYVSLGWETLMTDYISDCETIGKNVIWVRDGEEIQGEAKEIQQDGTLILISGKKKWVVNSGEIISQAEIGREE